MNRLLFTVSFLLFPAMEALGDADEHLLGNWGGAHSYLSEHGVDSEAVVTVDSMSNVSGGVSEESALLGNVDLVFNLDTERAGMWKGGTFSVYGLANFGDSLGELVGDLQGADNIEAYGTAKLYEAWYQHSFCDAASLLVGLHDYNSEFYTLEHTAGFINSSFGIGPDTSQASPSIFPTTGWTTRVRLNPTEQSYLLLAVYDGVPGSAYDQVGTQIGWNSDEGLFNAAEIGLIGDEESYYKVGVGGWWHTTDFVDYEDRERSDNYGSYLIAESALTDATGVFIQFGWAGPSGNQVARYYGAGFTWVGPAESRPEDLLSLGVAIAENGTQYERAFEADGSETVFELNYRVQATPFFAVTPDIQFILNPGTDPALDDAVVLGFRTEVVL